MGIRALVYSASARKEGASFDLAAITGMETLIGSMSHPVSRFERGLLRRQVMQWVEITKRRKWDKLNRIYPLEDLRIKVDLGFNTRPEVLRLYKSSRTPLDNYSVRIQDGDRV